MASHGADQIMVQRYLCARSLGQARAALVLSGFVVLAQFLLFLLIGVGLWALVGARLLELEPGTRSDEVFGAFIVRHLPTGVVGLVIAAVLAAAMSTLSSSLNSSASAAVNDFYRPLRPNREEGHYLRVSRGLTVFWGLAQMAVALGALALDSPRSIVDMVLSVAGFTTGIILGLFLLGQMSRPVASTAALVGLVVGFGTVFAVWWRTPLAWPWYAPVGAITTIAAALLSHALGVGNGSSSDRGKEPRLDAPR
jgi:Na+/proline symporter